MAMRQKTRSKGLKRSEQLLGAGTNAQEYGTGVIGPDPRRTSALVVMALALAVAFSFVFLGVIIIPGVFLVAAIYGAIDRPASVVVTNRGVAVFARSEFNGHPRKILTMLPQGVLAAPTVVRTGAYVRLPDLHLWFRKKEYDRLLAATDSKLVSNPWTSPVPVGVAANGPVGLNPGSTHPAVTAAVASPPAQGSPAEAPAFQPKDESGVIYCSWCGKQRAINAQAIHHCGSKDRPAVYCMNCGISFEEGAVVCTSCGTSATQISR